MLGFKMRIFRKNTEIICGVIFDFFVIFVSKMTIEARNSKIENFSEFTLFMLRAIRICMQMVQIELHFRCYCMRIP